MFFLFVPVRYKLSGSCKRIISFNFKASFSPLLLFKGEWQSSIDGPLRARLVIAGINVRLDPNKQDKEKKAKKKEKQKELPPRFYIQNLDKAFLSSCIKLVKDILMILKPSTLTIKAQIGFDEPHLTGYLAAVKGLASEWAGRSWIEIKPVWDGEYYEGYLYLEGRIILFAILIKIVRFMITKRTRQFLRAMKVEKKSIKQNATI